MTCGGIILCGGKSSRMGYPKAWLPFGPELMLPRIVRLLSEVVDPVVVVAAPGQDLPPLPAEVLIVRDRSEGRGPLEGLSAGLAAISRPSANTFPVEIAYATSCDVPLLAPPFVQRMTSLCEEYDIAVPYVGGYYHPLAAAYRATVLGEMERLLKEDRLRPAFIFEEVRTRVVSEADLRDVDRGLDSLRNLNHPTDYFAALKAAGFEAPAEIRARLVMLSKDLARTIAGQSPRYGLDFVSLGLVASFLAFERSIV